MEDKQNLLTSLVHPKEAKVGDFVFVWGGDGPEIVQITAVARGGKVRVEGNKTPILRTALLPPTSHRKQQYLERLKLSRVPVVGAFISPTPLPKFPAEQYTSPHVVGRPNLVLSDLEVTRSPSDYLDIRFSLRNDGDVTVTLAGYQHEYDREDKDRVPFAYMGDQRHVVFQVEGDTKVYPGRLAHFRTVASNRAGHGEMRLFIPSSVLGGAIGTYTMFVFTAPAPGTSPS